MFVLLAIGIGGLLLLVASLLFGELLDFIDLDFDGLAGDLFSTAGLAGFASALGFVGAIAINFVMLPVALAVGFVAGIGTALAVAWATIQLKNSADHSTVTSNSLVGRTGRVIEDIPAGGYGIVNVTVAGHITRLNARSREAIRAGTLIEVVDVISSTAVFVRHGEPIAPGDPNPPTATH